MGFAQAGYLFPQRRMHQAERVPCRTVSIAVVHGIDRREGIVVRKVLVEPGSSKVFANVLHRIAEGFGNPAWRSRGG